MVELLIVIAIIAILAGVGIPVMQGGIERANYNKAMQNARQIGIAMVGYASDHGGSFPGIEDEDGAAYSSSNEVFRELFTTYCDNEEIFIVEGSNYGWRVDNKIDTDGDILKPGENHFAVVAGLRMSSRSTHPMIVDGTAGGSTYTTREGSLGSRWKGEKAVVVRVDSSVGSVSLEGSGEARYIPRTGDKNQNALEVNDYMGDRVKLLNPAR